MRQDYIDHLERRGDHEELARYLSTVARLNAVRPGIGRLAQSGAFTGELLTASAEDETPYAQVRNHWAVLSLSGDRGRISASMQFRGMHGRVNAFALLSPLNPSGSLPGMEVSLGGAQMIGSPFWFQNLSNEFPFTVPAPCGYSVVGTVGFKAAITDPVLNTEVDTHETSSPTSIAYQPSCTSYCAIGGGGGGDVPPPPNETALPLTGSSVDIGGFNPTSTSGSCPQGGGGPSDWDNGGGYYLVICAYLDHYDPDGNYTYSELLWCTQEYMR